MGPLVDVSKSNHALVDCLCLLLTVAAGCSLMTAANVLFRPVDGKLPRIRIATRQREALLGKRIVVAVDSWPATSRFPQGHYVRTLGPIGDKATETKVSRLGLGASIWVPAACDV